MNKKYELTTKTIQHGGRTLYKIRALKDFANVKAGDLGGYVQSEDNLSHEGDCWIYDEAKVYDKAMVFEDALVCDQAIIHDQAMVFDVVSVCGNAKIYNDAKVCGNLEVNNYD